MATPSVAVVEDTCRAACKAMKLQSKQLLTLSACYAKKPFDDNTEILKALGVTMKSIQTIQESLTSAAISMRQDLDDDPSQKDYFPHTILVTAKEYAFLNAVFQEYTNSMTSKNNSSKDFSLFSATSDICASSRPCQDNAEKSNDSSGTSPNPSPPPKLKKCTSL